MWDPPSSDWAKVTLYMSYCITEVFTWLTTLETLNKLWFFQFRNSSKSHCLTLMCEHSRSNVYRYCFVNVIDFWYRLPITATSISILQKLDPSISWIPTIQYCKSPYHNAAQTLLFYHLHMQGECWAMSVYNSRKCIVYLEWGNAISCTLATIIHLLLL